MVNILIGGDICPTGTIQNAFIDGNANAIFHDLLDEIAKTDLSIANLECPIISRETPIVKAGLILGASNKCIKGFMAAKWNVLNLANNHSFDHGARGLQETIQTIRQAGLCVVGAGLNIKEAQEPFITKINGKRIVIYSMAEREYSIADEKIPGANPLDLINFANAIKQYKHHDIFIVLLHGGKEHYPYPSPEMVRRCRFMVDMGADAVICCHTHCPLPWEIYAERPIVYGLGNLVFEPLHKPPITWYEGYLAKLTIEGKNVRLKAIPYFQSHEQSGARKMNDVEQKHFFDEMKKKNAQIQDNKFLKQQWVNHCRKHKDLYLEELFGYNRLMSKARSLLLNILHSKKEVLRALHMVQCETHQEILNTIFKDEREIVLDESEKHRL